MKIKQVSEKIIANNYEKLDNIKHMESDLYLKDGLVYKIYNNVYRLDRYKYMYMLTDINFINACNVIDELFQGDKFIGITLPYLQNFKTLLTLLNNLDLYETKIIFKSIIEFFNEALNKNFLYWDIHLNNMGFSKDKFYIVDIDSMIYNYSKKDLSYAINNLLCLFYELCFKTHLRAKYDNYKNIIFYLCDNEKFLNNELNLDDLKKIIDNTTQNFIDINKLIFKKV